MSIKNLLDKATINGNSIHMGKELDPTSWSQFRSIMNRAGGTWHTQTQSFQFERDPQMLVDRLLEAGSRGFNKFHLYETPESVTDFISEYSLNEFCPDFASGKIRILEPSIGGASLISPIVAILQEWYPDMEIEVVGYDIDPINVALCEQRGYTVTEQDFLTVEPDASFDLVIMNPPFNGRTYQKHIKHAQKFLTPRKMSLLVAVGPTKDVKTKPLECGHTQWLYCEAYKVNSDFITEPFDKRTFKGATVETGIFCLRHKDYVCDDAEVNRYNHHEAIRLDNTNLENEATIPDPRLPRWEYQAQLITLVDMFLNDAMTHDLYLDFYRADHEPAKTYFLDRLGVMPDLGAQYGTVIDGDQVALNF